jgi:hypothetical protein
MSEEHEPKIRVRDRRLFNLDGSPRTPDAPAEDDTATPPAKPVEPPREASAQPPKPGPAAAPGPARADGPGLFGDLVVNLASQAAMYLGIVDDPLGPRVPKNMAAARQMIDIIDMLKQKTRGNLTDEETSLVEQMLHELRMQYVAVANKPKR